MAEWLWELVSISGTPLAEFRPRQRRLSLVRRGAGSASCSMTLAEAGIPAIKEVLAVDEVDLRVGRGGTAVFRGPVAGLTPELEDVGGTLQLSAVGIWEVLADRYTDAPYSILATEQTTIAWQLIALTQARSNGDLGITQGQLPASVARSVEWQTRTPIKSAIEDLASQDRGFDFSLTPQGTGWVFDCFYPRMGGRRDVVLARGTNVKKVTPIFDGGPGKLVNAATVVGAGGVYVSVDDVASQVARRRREAVETVAGDDASDAVLLGDRARAIIRERGEVRPSLQVACLPGKVTLDDLSVGDTVAVELAEGWLDLTGDYRVEQIDVELPDEGDVEALTVHATPELPA